MEPRIEKLEKEIAEIKARNLRVEGNKAWEISYFRMILISILIYLVAAKLLYFIGAGNYMLNALVPAIGYFVSVQSLPFIKQWWLKNHGKK